VNIRQENRREEKSNTRIWEIEKRI